MNPIFLRLSFFLTWCVWSCAPEDNTLVVSSVKGHSLTLLDHAVVQSVGARNHQPVLTFDGKTVSDQNVGFPLLVGQYPNWIILDYDSVRASSTYQPWTVYVSPARFSLADFNQLAACLDAKRAEFDAALAAIPAPDYRKIDRIGRLVYGEAPQTRVFRPAYPRYQTADGNESEIEECFMIRPDGNWSFQVSALDGLGSRMTANMAQGTLQARNGRLVLEKTFEGNDPFFKVRTPMAGLSNADYLQTFTDSTGKPLLSVIQYPY